MNGSESDMLSWRYEFSGVKAMVYILMLFDCRAQLPTVIVDVAKLPGRRSGREGLSIGD